MAFGVHQKVSHDISSAFGKGLHGLKVEAMANQRKPNNQKKGEGRRRLSGRALVESIMLGIFTITVAAIPVIVTRVPAPESLIIAKEILQDWCTPSICFVVLIVGVMIATSGVWGSDSGSTPEQNHKVFADSYLTQGPVSATQMDPLRMPDIFFSADAARAHSVSHSAAFPVRVAQPSSVMVPVYYPAFVPPQPSPFSHKSEKDVEVERFLPRHDARFESTGMERFSPRMEDRFVPRVDDRFSPRVDDRFSPRMEERFVPRVDERFSPKVEERFVPRVEERFSPRVEERFVPKVEEPYVPGVEERYVLEVEERYVPQVEERYEPQEQDRFEAEEEDTYEPEEEVRYDANVESRALHDDEEARSDSEYEGRYAPVEEAESGREDEVESERGERYVESEADDEGEVEPEVEMRSDSEDEAQHYSHEHHNSYGSHVQQPLPSESVDSGKVVSPSHSPIAPTAVEVAPVHTQLPSSQSQSYNSSSIAPEAEALSSLLSRRRPPTVPTPVGVQKAPPPPPAVSEPVASFPEEPKMSVCVEGKEAPEMSPRTPPKHANGRRTLSSSSSRSYAEFVKRASNFSPRTPLNPPRPLFTPKAPLPSTISKPDAAAPVGVSPKMVSSPKTGTDETSLVRLKTRRHSTGGSALMRQVSMPNRKPREVRVVDDDKLDDIDQTQDPAEDDDVDQRVEAFLKNFREQMRLQRQESLQRHRRGDIDP